MNIKAAYISKQGGRKKNEDYAAYAEKERYGCYLVADGLGGHYGGDLASKAVVKAILKAFNDSPGASVDHLKSYLDFAAKAMQRIRQELGREGALKTTLVALLIGRSGATWAHLGDSRLYYFRKGRLAFQTKDHSLPQRLVDLGEIRQDQVRCHEDRNRLLYVLDGEDTSRFTFSEKAVPLCAGDAFLLCSDGFWEYLYEEEMEKDLHASSTPDEWIDRMERKLLKRVEAKHDNYTALAVMVR